jgi:hypothetical protein
MFHGMTNNAFFGIHDRFACVGRLNRRNGIFVAARSVFIGKQKMASSSIANEKENGKLAKKRKHICSHNLTSKTYKKPTRWLCLF